MKPLLHTTPGARATCEAFRFKRVISIGQSLQFKKVGRYCSVRVGLRYRALAVDVDDGYLWFWIGSHADYDKLVG